MKKTIPSPILSSILLLLCFSSPINGRANSLCQQPNPFANERYCNVAELTACYEKYRLACTIAAEEVRDETIQIQSIENFQAGRETERFSLEQKAQALGANLTLARAERADLASAQKKNKPLFPHGPPPEDIRAFGIHGSWGELHPAERRQRLEKKIAEEKRRLLMIELKLGDLRSEIEAVEHDLQGRRRRAWSRWEPIPGLMEKAADTCRVTVCHSNG